jgi:hypothetical protein
MPFARGDDTAAGVIQPCKPDVVPDRVTSEPRDSAGDFPQMSTAAPGRVVDSVCMLDGRAKLAVEVKTLIAEVHPPQR